MNWFLSCLAFTAVLACLVCLPIWRHPSLPRRRKLLFSIIIFLWLVVGGILIYSDVGMPLMALL